ncbi:TIGR03749 family integrating conjugative element protein [Carnimonas bestiolae]|uniref:TIGR03749 family integrating conjugative element protein n=1 Tax=Carnimonas bestiolae TaxID=3402172 RepID=UPI003EDBA09F
MKRLIHPVITSVALLSGVMVGTSAHAVEIMKWDRLPLTIDLPVGQERVVALDRNVEVGLPKSIANEETLRVQSSGGAIYLKANKAFDTQRVGLKDVQSGEIILVDLTAKKDGASSEDIKVVDETSSSKSTTGQDDSPNDNDEQAHGTPTPVLLTRYAAQTLYAPERTIENVSGITRSAMRLPASMPSLLPSLPVSLTPLAAWKMGNYVATAVRITNEDPARSFKMDPRWLQGQLYSATFMHPTIGPRGSADDTTTVFVVTRGKSLAKSVPLSQEVSNDS